MACALLHSTLAAPAPRHQPSAVEAAGINQWMSNVLNPWGAGMWEAYGGPYWAAAGMSNVPYGVWAQGLKPRNKGGMTAEAAAKMHSLEREGGRPERDRVGGIHSAGERLESLRRRERKGNSVASAQTVPQGLRSPEYASLAMERQEAAAGTGAEQGRRRPSLADRPSVRSSRWGAMGDLWAPPPTEVRADPAQGPHGWAGKADSAFAGHVAGPQ